MAAKIYPIFSQDLDSGTTGEFGIGEDGQAYWNGKPIVTQEKVVLQGWVSVAIILTALAAIGQVILAGMTYRSTLMARPVAEVNAIAESEHWKGVATKAYTEAYIAKNNGKPGNVAIPKGTRLVSPDGGKTFLIVPPSDY